MRRPEVEILFFPGCPNLAATRRLVEDIAAELGADAEIHLVEVADPGAADGLRFLGSPSVRVDGRDVEPGAELRHDYVFACRIYRGPRGVGGSPDASWIREALARAAT